MNLLYFSFVSESESSMRTFHKTALTVPSKQSVVVFVSLTLLGQVDMLPHGHAREAILFLECFVKTALKVSTEQQGVVAK